MKNLSLLNLETIDHIVFPEEFQDTTLKSSALTIFTDFKKIKPLIIDASTKAVDAQLLMLKAHVSLKLVLSAEKRIVGILSSHDVSERHIVQKISQGENRNDLMVTDLMQERSELLALDYMELKNARVEDVLSTLQTNGLRHCLVVEHSEHQIRGLISTSDIAKQLHIPLSKDKPLTFANIYTAIHI